MFYQSVLEILYSSPMSAATPKPAAMRNASTLKASMAECVNIVTAAVKTAIESSIRHRPDISAAAIVIASTGVTDASGGKRQQRQSQADFEIAKTVK